jgi:sugar phosphate isomerase/epimerase
MENKYPVFIHLPYRMIPQWSNEAKKYGHLNGFELFIYGETYSKITEKDIQFIEENTKGYELTLHAPYMDIGLAPFDDDIYEIARKRLLDAIALGSTLNVKSIIIHTSFDYIRIQTERIEKKWVNRAKKMIESIISKGNIPQLLLENVFESDPEMFFRIFDKLTTVYPFGVCFDTGHCNYLSKVPMKDWYEYFNKNLKQIHLHDNDGSWDQHLPPGMGKINFDRLFSKLVEKKLTPRLVMEMHKLSYVNEGLKRIKKIINKEKQY